MCLLRSLHLQFLQEKLHQTSTHAFLQNLKLELYGRISKAQTQISYTGIPPPLFGTHMM